MRPKSLNTNWALCTSIRSVKFTVFCKNGYFCNKSIPTCVMSVPDHHNSSIFVASTRCYCFRNDHKNNKMIFGRLLSILPLPLSSCSYKMFLANFKLVIYGQPNFVPAPLYSICILITFCSSLL